MDLRGFHLRISGAEDLAEDLRTLAAQRVDFFADQHRLIPRPSPARFEEFLRATFERGGVAIAILEEAPRGNYVGSICLEAGRPWAWSDAVVLGDRWLHVLADRRGGAAVRHLVRFGLALARRRGVPLFIGAGLGIGRSRLIE